MRKYSVNYEEEKMERYPFLPPFGHKHHNVNKFVKPYRANGLAGRAVEERSTAGSTQTSQKRMSVVRGAIIGHSDSQHQEWQRQLVKH